ncbi:helix-turn-helix domain-containing protein [Escherichia marmotae]|uniref:helix-turn-helix domain-containing protein n=1 Tax=Escherichia marmotae TaxID=1499973 RepID=UPI003CE6B31F
MSKETTVDAILNYIENNLEAKLIDINSLVIYSGYSRRYIQQIFRNNIGMPVGKYIQRRRTTRAAVLLRLTRLSIITISERLCYDSQQTFTREFKKNTGYTPLQYRRDKVWTFRNQTGHRRLNISFPVPELWSLERKKIHGFNINYKEKIPFNAMYSQQKWDVVKSLLSKSETPLFISNSTRPDEKISDSFIIHSIFWAKGKDSQTKYFIDKGIYARFTYNGEIESYIFHINNIYLNVLSYYALQKREGFDLEVISKNNNGEFEFEYFLPIKNDGNLSIPDTHNFTFPY